MLKRIIDLSIRQRWLVLIAVAAMAALRARPDSPLAFFLAGRLS